MYVIVGLGNPDLKYRTTRHNAGYLALDLLADKFGMRFEKKACKSVLAEGRIGTQRVVLAKPITYMNLSGEAVVALINWYKIDPADELIVLCDDIDLPAGEIRIRPRGSAGTHNGLRNILYLTGTDTFARVRIGVGAPPKGWDLANYVLASFPEEEQDVIQSGLSHAAEAAELIVQEGIMAAQQKFNVKKRRVKEAATQPSAEKETAEQSASAAKADNAVTSPSTASD